MSARLRVVLDQVVQVVDPDQAAAALDLARGLVATAPSGCSVEAIVPAGAEVPVDGLSGTRALPLARRELAASWQLGIVPGVGGGMIHSPSLLAPLVRHDRVHDHHQTTVTLWCLDAWEAPETVSKASAAWQRAMLKRAVRHADAVVVPTHAIAERLAGIARLGDRIRVIAGAPPAHFALPADAASRRATLGLPSRYIALSGTMDSLRPGFRAAMAAGVDAVVLDAPEGTEPRLAEIAAAAGLPEARAHIRSALSPEDRAAALDGASVFCATNEWARWPWRAVEAMVLGIPIVARDSGTHRDVIADGGLLVSEEEIADAVVDAADRDGATASRLGVLAADRSRAFSWASSAERVWSLHADL